MPPTNYTIKAVYQAIVISALDNVIGTWEEELEKLDDENPKHKKRVQRFEVMIEDAKRIRREIEACAG